jgi:hypothetical protein
MFLSLLRVNYHKLFQRTVSVDIVIYQHLHAAMHPIMIKLNGIDFWLGVGS